MLKNKYLLSISILGIILCCILLISIFITQINYQKNIDKIFDKYEKDMIELHKN